MASAGDPLLSQDDLDLINDIEQGLSLATPVEPTVAIEASQVAPLQQYQTVVDQIHQMAEETNASFRSISTCLEDLKQINSSRLDILSKTSDFNRECTDLLTQRDFLVRVSSEVQSKYYYYTQLKRVRNEIVNLKLDRPTARKRFLPVLAEIEDCLMFFNENPHYTRAEVMLADYDALLNEWLDFLETMTNETFQKFYTNVDNFYQKAPEADEFSVIFAHLKERRQYGDVLDRVKDVFFFIRLNILIPSAEAHVEQLLSQDVDKSELLRGSCELLQRMITKESKIYGYYFAEENKYQISRYLKNAVNLVSGKLYDVIRPLIIHENDVLVLTEMAQIIKQEFLEEKIHFFSKLYQDLQQRIVFRVEIFVNESLQDVDTVVDSSLEILSIVYNRVDSSIFHGLAQDVIDNCLYTLRQLIQRPEFFQSHLTLIESLKRLRFDLSAMLENVDITTSMRELDFSATRHLFWKLVSGEVHVRNSFFELVQQGSPFVTEKTLSVREMIDEELKHTFNSLIMATFNNNAQSLILFLTRSRYTKLDYDEAIKAIEETKAKLTLVFPEYLTSLRQKKYEEEEDLLNEIKVFLRKAFQQVIGYMNKNYPDKETPTIIQIESFLDTIMVNVVSQEPRKDSVDVAPNVGHGPPTNPPSEEQSEVNDTTQEETKSEESLTKPADQDEVKEPQESLPIESELAELDNTNQTDSNEPDIVHNDPSVDAKNPNSPTEEDN